ncbi:AAA domain (dynein-related subfamily) [Loktanella fryxellensis]|uniref:AAA domain (Dynein-related subfamily) n=1 Tax=Loktanella fryxellensis TaxID=245187 RepID=A0A1H8EES4_9RHOB|nr:AAA family ATPase [Loktanella fryxellensis]SEN18081.1 AAA domain (dynein-related subfamily) [Loktanella fryxellensis]
MTINTTPISAGRALDALRAGHAAQRAGTLTASWMLHGRPGIGKTEIVSQLAAETGSRLFDLRLTTIEPQDLRGLPFYDHDARRTVWYPPQDLPDDPDRPAILFLDELTAAAPALQPTVYGLLQERRVGLHVLPANTFIVAAGNTVDDGAIAYEMGTALSDRLIHLSVVAEASDWITRYAVPQGLHPAVTAFIRTRPDLLDTTADALQRGRMIACTPRSWARVSAILRAVPDRTLRDIMIAGTLGDAAAAEFILLEQEIAATVQVSDMVAARPSDRTALYPANLHGLTALVYALVTLAERETLPDCIAIVADIRRLGTLRDDPAFARLPLAELTTYGMELLIERALAQGWEEAFRTSQPYAAYMADRAP